MDFIKDMQIIKESNEVSTATKKFFENIGKAVLGDTSAAIDAAKILASSPFLIQQTLFWGKFTMFLEGVFIDDESIRKMSEIFVEHEERVDYSMRIIKIIDEIDTKTKTKFITNLTRSLLAKFITKTDYYRLCNIVRSTLEEDLNYVSKNIFKESVTNNMQIEFLRQSGLVVCTHEASDNKDDIFKFTPLAKMLDMYGLDYENENKYRYSDRVAPLIEQKLYEKTAEIDGGTF